MYFWHIKISKKKFNRKIISEKTILPEMSLIIWMKIKINEPFRTRKIETPHAS